METGPCSGVQGGLRGVEPVPARISTVGRVWFKDRHVSMFCSILASLSQRFLGNSSLASKDSSLGDLKFSIAGDEENLQFDHWTGVSGEFFFGDLHFSLFFISFFFFGGVQLFSTSSTLLLSMSICFTGCWSFFSFLYLQFREKHFEKLCGIL